jgi:hypothetical protein
MQRGVYRLCLAAAVLYATWMGMMAVHELGHMLHAWLSGGRVIEVRMPLLGFSQTIVHPNPRERFVVWGGPIWGVLIPLLACGLLRVVRGAAPDLLKFFAGFCCIANGAYIGLGWTKRAGDAADLRRLGVSPALMIALGLVCMSAGFYLWHRTSWLTMQKERRDD